ncbi:MAG: hypothetical protein AB1349_07190 [Elusimicrobiota bacterium]
MSTTSELLGLAVGGFIGDKIGALAQQAVLSSLLIWSRRAELTADRAGLIACQDIKIAERVIIKLGLGTKDIQKRSQQRNS